MKTGERVVCVETKGNVYGHSVKKGQIYTINNVWTCPSCGKFKLDVGLYHNMSGRNGGCVKCSLDGPDISVIWCDSRLFRPIQYNSAHSELVQKAVTIEKSDIPIKEPQKATS